MGKIYLIGTGPGNPDYLLPLARKKILASEVLIGSKRLLTEFNFAKEYIYLEKNYDVVLNYLQKNKAQKKIVVLVSGDAGIFSFAKKITPILDFNDYEIIPGISILQLAFARIKESWENVFILSLHGRKKENLNKILKNHKKIFIYTDPKNTPSKIAKYLLKNGYSNNQVFVFYNLSYKDEKIIKTNLKNLLKMKDEKGKLCVMLIK